TGEETNNPPANTVAIGSDFSPDSDGEVLLVLAGRQRQRLAGEEVEVIHAPGGQVRVNARVTREDAPSGVRVDAEPFNHLIVPAGKRSSVTFPDGSRVWVNAGSHLWYPVEWKEDRREVFIEGEIFVDAARDTARPFVVTTGLLEIEVLGTRFNVTARDASANAVVLERGSVRVRTPRREEVLLVPDQRLEYRGGELSVGRVETRQYTAWKDGLLYFNGTPLGEILARLGNYYGREIAYDNAGAELTCSGTLELKATVEEVLEGLTHTVPVRVVRVRGNIHVINTP
ncbi:MAG: FecR domain-containing protein, partial [Odoribacteraceae bacterium]|nr:FecR domain-containing protein [Odoribacteraceae bacterium]